MASNGLSELISVTNNVVKSLSSGSAQERNRHITNNALVNMDPCSAGSPFESPKSHGSQSDCGIEKVQKPEPSFPRGIDSKIEKNTRQYGKDSKERKEDNHFKDHNIPPGDIGLDNPKKAIEEQGKYIHAKGIDQNVSGEEPQIIDVQAKTIEITTLFGTGHEALDESGESGGTTCQSGQFFPSKVHGKASSVQYQSLTQGALSKGALDPTQQNVFDDVYISQFHTTDRQRSIRETLAKKSEDSKPKKQHIQPQIIHSNSRSGDESDKDSIKHATRDRSQAKSTHPEADPSVTAAVAASAAVAAAQPFLKAQQDLETRMQQLLTQLQQKQEEASQIEKEKVSRNMNSTALEKDDVYSEKRISELERQVAEMNERRLEHLESLQQQQMQMQAQLLMMSRSKSPKSQVVLPARQASPPRALQGSRIPQAVTKSNKDTSSRGGLQFHSRQQEPMASQLQSSYFNPETLSKHHNYLSEVRELQGSLLDTPAPRKTVPEPTPYSLIEEPHTNLGFLQELLNQKETPVRDTTFSVKGNKSPGILSNRNNNAKGKRLDKSPVDQARRLVNSLSTLERETSESVWGSKEALNKDMELVHEGPAPLDFYLKYPRATEESPYPNFGDKKEHLEKKPRRRSHSGNYLEAKQVLKELEMTKNTLERNLEQVVRSQRDVHVFNALLSQACDGGINDQMRIEKLVSKKIASLNEDIQTQVLRGLAEEEAKKLAMEMEQAQLKAAAKKNAGRFDYSKANTFKRMVEEAKLSQSKVGLPVTRFATKAKENKILPKKQPAKPNVITDEKTMTRTYGKAEYQRGRTTIRDPYLHFQNTKKGRPIGLNDSFVSRDGRSRSPKNKKTFKSAVEPHIPRQYFFSPTRGYIPLESATSGPIEGQMIPMAIPLGAPRMEPGVRKTAAPVLSTSPDPITSTPVPVTAMTRNAAVISFPVESERDKREREPELSKQVLPPIDIDSISPSSSRRSDIQLRSPQQAHPNVTFLCESYDSQEVNLNMNKNLEDESDDDQTGEGIKLPGYEPKVPYYTGPSFPPQASAAKPDWMAGGEQVHPPPLVSDVMAEDLRRRDVLENNAIVWLEQELMARVLTEVMPLKMAKENVDVSTAQSLKSDESEREDSLLVADMIGQSGLQLFIDAGQPVDNALVNALVKDVIQERINSMLSQRDNEDEKHRTAAKSNVRDDDEAALQEREQAKPSQIPTPEMTPKTSPVASPRRYKTHIQQPETPPLSPPPNANIFKPPKDLIEETGASEMVTQQPPPRPRPILPVSQHIDMEKPQVPEVESESEVSVSVDISEELRRIGGKETEPSGYVEVCHDIATPPISPQPVLEEETAKPIIAPIQATPPVSPPPVTSVTKAEEPIPTKLRPESVKQQRMEEEVQEEEDKQEEEEDEEEEDEEIIEQPRPIMMSIAVGEDRPMSSDREMQAKPRSPSPQRCRSQSPPSESQPLSEESTLSESVNENISEGQWLLSRSEGQIVGLPGKVFSRDLRKGYQQMVDLSTASTLRDTEDIDLDESHGPKSDGEIMLSGLPAPEEDPMLELLVQMQKNPLLAIQKDLPKAHVSQVLQQPAQSNVTGRSLGEMSVGQVAPSRLVQVKPRRVEEREIQRRDKDRVSPSFSPNNSLERSGTEENYSFQEDKRMASRDVNGRQQGRTTSPQQQRYSQQQQQRNRSPELMPRPNNYGSKQSDFRNRARGQMQYQPVLSDSAPTATKSRSPAKYNRQRESAESYRVSRSSEQAYRKSGSSNFRQNENSISDLYSNDQMTRSADSLSYRRSGDGGLTSSLKSKQSNVKKSVEFDLTGTFGRTKSSVSRSKDSNLSGSSRLSNFGGSLGLTYSFDDSAEDELKRIMNDNGTSYGPYRMSVTLPSTGHENESDVSDFDFSQNE